MNFKKIYIIFTPIIVFGIILIVFLIKHNYNKKLDLIYEINAGIPFKWEYEIRDKDIVKVVETKVIKDENKGGKVGASIYTRYRFKGLKKGDTTITFRFVSITNGTISKEEIHNVRVDEDLNIYEY